MKMKTWLALWMLCALAFAGTPAVRGADPAPAEARAAEAAAPMETPAPAPQALAKPAALPYLVALDFAADAKNARLGSQVARMFRNKTARAKVCAVDSEIDWEGLAGRMELTPDDADARKCAEKARTAYDCDYLVWGAVESADPGDKNSRRLRLKCRVLDARAAKIVASRDFELGTNFEISQAVDEMVKAFAGVPTRADVAAAAPANFQEPFGPNLCPHGSLAPPPGADPAARDKGLPGWDFPFPGNVMLRRDADGSHCLEYDVAAGDIAEITGLFCYTPYIPIKPDTYYQVSFMVRTNGPRVIQFTKGYRDREVTDVAKPQTLRQETFKHQVRFYGQPGEWLRLTSKPFLPRAVKGEDAPQFLRVELYAYWPVGKVWFKDVSVRECRARQ